MDALALVLVFLGLLALAFTYAASVKQRPPTYREIVVKITADVSAFQAAMGERLIPAVNRAFRIFDEEIERAKATMSGGPESLSQEDWGEVGRTMREMYERHPRRDERTD